MSLIASLRDVEPDQLTTAQVTLMPLKPQGRIFNDITETIGGTPLVRINRLIPHGPGDRARQVRVLQPAGEREGPHRPGDDRGRRAGREDRQGHGHRRADQRQHRHRAGVRLRGQGLQADPDDARVDEHRAPPAAQGARRAGRADAGRRGHARRDQQGRGDRSSEHKKSFMPQQFENPANPEIHQPDDGRGDLGRTPTAQVDILVAGVGTGGTITGVAEVIKPRKPSFKAIAVEPVASPVITQTLQRRAGEAGPAQDPGHRRRLRPRQPAH